MKKPCKRRQLGIEQLEARRVLDAYISSCLLSPETGHEYFLLKSPETGLSWTQAKAAAENAGMQLATIRSQRELDWIAAANYDSPYIWLGLNDAENEGEFKWADGSTATFRNWHGVEPNDLGGEDFIAIYNWDGAGYQWNDFADITEYAGYPFAALAQIAREPNNWHNFEAPNDVNNDSIISPLDVLTIINDLNLNGSRPLNGEAGALIDVNADGVVSPVDVLLVINYLNDPQGHEVQLPPHQHEICGPSFSVRQGNPAGVMEGDFYYIDASRLVIDQPINLALEHNGIIVYEYDPVSVTGDSELRIVMPEVLPLRPPAEQGSDVDGYTLLISNGLYRDALPLAVREGLRMTVDVGEAREGGRIPFHIRNGIGESEVIAELLHDGSVVQSRRYDTDGSGILRTAFQLERHVFEFPRSEDGFELRLTHGGKSITKSILIRHGLQMWTSTKNIREGHEFTIGGRGAVGNTVLHVSVHIDGREYVLTNGHKESRSDGSIDLRYTMPKIITTSADRDGATIKVRTRSAHSDNPDLTDEETFEFGVTVHKGHHNEPEEETYPNNIVLPAKSVDNSLAGLARQAVLGATDEQLRSQVPSDVANDPSFIPVVREYSQPQGRGLNPISLLLLGLPRDAHASSDLPVAKTMISSVWSTLKNAFTSIFAPMQISGQTPTTSWSMNFAQALPIPPRLILQFPIGPSLTGSKLTGPFGQESLAGKGHLGSDFRGAQGTMVHSIGDGIVRFAGPSGSSGWGNVIIIEHDHPILGIFFSMYAHLQNVGDLRDVSMGQPIAEVGPKAEGSSAPHLHFEIRTGSQSTLANTPGYRGFNFDSYTMNNPPYDIVWHDPYQFILDHGTY